MCIISIAFGFYLGKSKHQDVVYVPYYKTVAHLNNVDAWVPLSKDTTNDIAYYTVSDDLIDFTMPSKGDVVSFTTKDTGVVEEISTYGFNLKVEPSTAKHGMSGTPVFNSEGEVIGYVSAAIGTKHIYCIWR